MNEQQSQMFFVESSSDLERIRGKLLCARRVAFDIEAGGDAWGDALHYGKAVVAGFCLVTDEVRTYFSLAHRGSTSINSDLAWRFLNRVVNTVPEVWMHNAKYDSKLAHRHGVVIPTHAVRDTQLAAHVLGHKHTALKLLSRELLGIKAPGFEDVVGNIPANQLPNDLVGPYCISDGTLTFKLADYFIPKMQRIGVYRAWLEVECPFTQVLTEMEATGFLFDSKRSIVYKKMLQEELQKIEKRIFDKVGRFNVSSPSMVGYKMFTEKGLWDMSFAKRGKPRKGGKIAPYGTDKKVLTLIQRHNSSVEGSVLAGLIIEYRGLKKLLTSFTDGLVEATADHADGRIRANLNQSVTHTGRLSCSNPNLQQIPKLSELGKEVRRAFIEEDGWSLVRCDYGQVELRVIAHFSQDENMLSIYRDGIDRNGNPMTDLHENTRVSIEELSRRDCNRTLAKNSNFGLGFGMSVGGFMRLHDLTETVAGDAFKGFHGAYPRIDEKNQWQVRYCKKHGYIKLLSGRRVWFDRSKNNYNNTMNAPVQGSAAEIMKMGLTNVLNVFRQNGELGKRVRILMTIHDEVLCGVRDDYVDEAVRLVHDAMILANTLSVPLTADPEVGKTWGDTESYVL